MLDRWTINVSQTAKLTQQQNAGAVTPPAGFSKYMGFTSSSAYSLLTTDYFVLRQAIEGNNVADLAWGTVSAATVSLSFWIRSSLTGTFGGSLYNYNGTRSYPFSYTISVANTWEYKTITIPGDTTGTWAATTGAGLYVSFSLGAGSTYNSPANAWAGGFYTQPSGSTSVVSSNAATWYVTGVQLEKAPQATAFDYRDFGRELVMCQRYFTKSQSWAAAVTAGEGQGLIAWNAVNTSVIAGWASHKVSMRTQPTITIYRQDGTINATNRFVDGAAVTGTTTCPEPGIEGFRYVSNASSGFTAGTYYQFYYTASAEL
jgi:hypothetical protein